MLLRELYERAIAIGIENNPGGKEAVSKDLEARKRACDSPKEDARGVFDPQSPRNPSIDSRILSGAGKEKIQHILCGRPKGKNLIVDLVLSHHPDVRRGKAPGNRSFGKRRRYRYIYEIRKTS